MGWRKAYGALKDSTKVGLAKINSQYKELDVAIVKATKHKECPPKESHIRKISTATSVLCPRADVTHCIHALARRLHKTRNWVVALKTLIVIHRTLREGDPIFREELLNYSRRAQILQIPNFKDDSSPLAWDCSTWARAYVGVKGLCSIAISYSIPWHWILDLGLWYYGKISNEESLKLPIATSHHWFLAGKQVKEISDFYEFCRSLELTRNFRFPILRQPPPSFLYAMEEYIKEAPQIGSVSKKTPEYQDKIIFTYNEDEEVEEKETAAFPPDSPKPPTQAEEKPPVEPERPQQPIPEVAPQPVPSTTGDLLCMDDFDPVAAELEESNALALAIIPPGNNCDSWATGEFREAETAGWELALVNAPSTNNSHLMENKLAGGFDKLFLDCLYEDANARSLQNAGGYYGGTMAFNHFGSMQDPFSMSSAIAPPPNVQMALMAQQQQFLLQQQQMVQQHNMMMMSYTQQCHYPQPQTLSSNPFGDPFTGISQTFPPGRA